MGCRLNQAETAILRSRFEAKGYAVTSDPLAADLFVLHTCTLTTHATARCRRRLRWLIKRNPDACVAAIGCYAQTDAEEIARIRGVDFVVGTADKLRLAEIIPAPVKLPEAAVINHAATRGAFAIEGAGRYPLRTRANIKVQEGCDFVCAFCIIPRSRGRARSRDFHDVLREARQLAAAGHREVVITGVNVGTYRDGARSLADLVKALADIDGLDRIRISSIEPTTVEDALLAEMACNRKLCRYLHVPLQSGDDEILARMRRRYDAGSWRAFMEEALARVPGIGLGTDVMVGFPGESEAAFERSCEMIHALPFVNVHVFSFSARPRTSAFVMEDPVAPAGIRRRSERLHRLALARKHDVYASQAGREMDVLFEGRSRNGVHTGFSDTYIRVRVESPDDLSNRIARVAVRGVERSHDGVIATGEVALEHGRQQDREERAAARRPHQ
ncbi:MAG TPA: tRNA (N(6)-L-threonylcarbamoyladenosine(37)-C(2))-methylthiotransferase MtaB, partial [Candidatus Krumholzibacteria bacterium]|nr:tRNA (N(6)-L-threonylcarbamoyladenosine(37)-C(2))-methylthiotransferase MtaB [Candidatus Krumholzibacteria bacterium]